MASAPHQAVMLQYLKMALQSGHGAAAAGLPLFEAAGINSIGSLTSFRPSFRNQSYDATELQELESALRGATPAVACPAWPSVVDTTAILKKILIAAHELSAAQEAAVVAALATQPTGSVTSTAAIALGVAQYKTAEQVHHASYLASERVQYELVGKAYKALQDGRPVSVVLEDIVLELASRSTKSDAVYTIAGKDFVPKDVSDKAITIVSFEDLYQQMERRAHMLSVAACFSHSDLMTKTGAPAPDPELIRKESTTRYVTTDASGNMTAKTMDLFGSPRILETQISKMKELRSQQPHLTVAQLRRSTSASTSGSSATWCSKGTPSTPPHSSAWRRARSCTPPPACPSPTSRASRRAAPARAAARSARPTARPTRPQPPTRRRSSRRSARSPTSRAARRAAARAKAAAPTAEDAAPRTLPPARPPQVRRAWSAPRTSARNSISGRQGAREEMHASTTISAASAAEITLTSRAITERCTRRARSGQQA